MAVLRKRRPTLGWVMIALVIVTALALGWTAWHAWQVRRQLGDLYNQQALAEQTARGLPRYELSLDFDPTCARVEGVMTLDFINTYNVPLSMLYFYVWPNSFSDEDYGIFYGEMAMAYPGGFDPGGLTVSSVTGPRGALAWAIQGAQGHVLAVELHQAVAPGGRTTVNIDYVVNIPACYGRFGYGDNTFSVVNAHPILCVYDDETGQWYDSYAYYSVGDPFYSQAADYRAQIRVPAGYEVAVTGSQSTRRRGDTWVTTVQGPAQRDFGFVVSDRFSCIEKTVGDTTVRSWYFSSDALGEQAARAAVDAVACFSRRFGPYGWDELDVVMCDFYIGGMEYPGMVLIDASQYTVTSAMTMEMIVAHEVGHQWWYAAVGSNQIAEPWLDEALTEFSTCLYFEDTYAPRGEAYRDAYVLGSYTLMEAYLDADEVSISSPVTDFDNNFEYSLVVYGRGAQMFLDLRDMIGGDAFYRSLRSYYAEHCFGLATGEDLIDAFEQGANQPLADWFAGYME